MPVVASGSAVIYLTIVYFITRPLAMAMREAGVLDRAETAVDLSHWSTIMNNTVRGIAMIDWYVEGVSYGNCNCAYGCPCQFEALPTYGNCRGLEVLRIDKGAFGDVELAGLRIAMFYAWPGPIFEGKGELQAVIDEAADADQRNALETILHGGETEEAATHWWVFRAMSDTVHPTLFKPIEFDVDIEARTARAVIPGVLDSTGSPIRPPHSDGEHRVRIDLPNGIEFEFAEIGSGTSTTGTESAVKLDLKDSYGQFNELRHSGTGVVHA